MCSDCSRIRCASPASVIGRYVWMIGRSRPFSTTGQTCSRTPLTIAAFSASGRIRSAGRHHAGALDQQRAEVELGDPAALQTDDDEPAVDGQRLQVTVQIGRTHDVQDDVGAVPAGRRADGGDEVLVGVVDGDLGPERHAAPRAWRPARW